VPISASGSLNIALSDMQGAEALGNSELFPRDSRLRLTVEKTEPEPIYLSDSRSAAMATEVLQRTIMR
jgi:hypothetical protein